MQTTAFAAGSVGVAGSSGARLASKGTLLVVLSWWPPQIAALSPSPRRADSMTYPRNTEQVLFASGPLSTLLYQPAAITVPPREKSCDNSWTSIIFT